MPASKLYRKVNLSGRYLLIKFGLRENMESSFFIIGAQRSGTTSLFHYVMNYASNFAPSIRKEILYYDYMYYKGFEYHRL